MDTPGMDAIPGRPETTGSTVVYRNPWMSVREDTFRRADGSAGLYGVVDKQDFSIVIAEVTPEGTAEVSSVGSGSAFHLVEQYRYPLSRRAWEFPMGTWPAGAAGSPLDLARAELREETGVRAERWRHLGHLNEAGGFCSQGFDVYHATGLTAGAHAREASEADMVHAVVGEDEFGRMIDDGRVVDAATIAAYLLLLRHRARPST